MTKVSFTTKDGKKVSFSTKGTKKRKKGSTKKRKTTKRKTKTTKSRSSPKKSVAKKKGGSKKGTSGMTRVKKVLLGLGIGAAFSTIAAITRIREIEGVAPIIDAAVGGGVEAQIGTAIPRTIRILASRGGFNFGNSSNGNMALEGA